MSEKNCANDRQKKPVPVDGKNFIGVGKMAFASNADWNIPHLHFMVDKTTSGNYEATLLEFGLVSWAEKATDSIVDLAKQTYFYILSVIEKAGFDQLIEDVDDCVMEEYWRQYRKIEFSLARVGKDLSHDIDAQLMRAIKGMISEETKKFISDMGQDNAERIIAEYDRRSSITSPTLNYTKLGEAA